MYKLTDHVDIEIIAGPALLLFQRINKRSLIQKGII